ncbi:Inositol transporter 1 [Chlorella sorokiniana]|uniref:Inositol transporter 1 n=1 Tax=Chlorella sorokiniana TaxID=3076 RepID=A0A2P6TM87_CHLSO|nr:Inositol transporter 1 [Chlorella sorokiniana]|eukprot:PRW45452.1 Inositol transporter 1 [Chlorella sorokiniana]
MAAPALRPGALPPELELAAGTHREIELDEEDVPLVSDRSDEPAATWKSPATSAAATAPDKRSPLLFITLIASLGGVLFGFDTGVISGALPYIRDDILLPRYAGQPAALAHWQELIVSAAILAAGVGSVLGGWVADRLGRKAALLLADVLFAAGSAAMAAAQEQWALIAGRALVGLGVGLASVTVPIYIAECAPPARRASLVTVNVLAITGGQFVAYVADFLFSFVPGTWRWMLGIAALPALAQMAGLALLPESPKWLASKGRTAAAERALQRLQPGRVGAAGAAAGKGGSDLDGAAGSSAAIVSDSSSRGTGVSSWRLLRSRTVLKELHVGVGLQVLQQVAGINTVMYFTPSILQLAGDLLAPGVCLALSAQHDASPEGGSSGAPGSCAAPARLFLHGCPSRHTWLILCCLVAYLAAFSPGLGPVPWAVNAEIYPLQVRGLATGIAATANWVSNAVVAQTFLTLTQRLGGSGAFYLYCGIAAGGFAWTYRFLPETNGLSLEQVQRLFAGTGGSDGGGSLASGSGREPKWRGSDDEGGDTERLAGEVEL